MGMSPSAAWAWWLPRASASLTVACSLITVALVACPARAADYFVSPNGDDANSGTVDQPFRTIAHGASVLAPGDTLQLRAGTYEEGLYNGMSAGTSWQAPVTIAAYPGEQPIMRPPVGADRVFTFSADSVHHVVVRGLVLDAVNVTYDAVKVTYGSSGASHHIRLEACEVMNSPGQGILVTGADAASGLDVTANEFIGLDVHDNGTTDFDHGFYISTAGNQIQGCAVHHNAGWGIHVYNGSADNADDNLVVGNRVYDNAAAGARGVGIGIYSGSGTLAYNNLVWGNQVGLALNYNAATAGVFYNVLYANVGDGISVGDGSSDARVLDNLVFGNGAAVTDQGTATQLQANLEQDPAFVDAPNHDFHLQSTSAAIDQGVAVPEVATDYAGVARPQGAAPDIGAFEYCPPPGCEGTGGSGAAGAAGPGGTSAGGAGAGAGAGPAAAASPSAEETGGCGCRVVGPPPAHPRPVVACLGVLAAAWLRPRRRLRPSR
jgi:hypothetical protein